MSADRSAEEYLREGQAHEVAGRVVAAADCYAAAAERAAQDGVPRALSDALRRRGVLYHLQGESERAQSLCCRAYDVALVAGQYDLAAEALNALAGFELEHGRLTEARQKFHAALEFAASAPELTGKIEQNLGVVANVRGDWTLAREHYERALAAYERTRDLRGCAIAYHNIGRIHAERYDWEEAGRRFHQARQLARAAGDVHVLGLALLSHSEVYLALGQYAAARETAEEALSIFAKIDVARDLAGAHRLLGAICREQQRFEEAELHFTLALDIARQTDCPLEEADVNREMARLCRLQGRKHQALAFLGQARGLYLRIDAPNDLDEIDAEIRQLTAEVAAA